MALPVLAQDDHKPQPEGERPQGRPGRGPGAGGGGGAAMGALSPEKAKAAWELQAKGVAADLKLSDDKAKELVKAYVDARTSQQAAVDKFREDARNKNKDAKKDGDKDAAPQPRGAEMRQEMDKINTTERGKLEKALTSAIGADQAKKALESLGSFNRGWDVMVDTVAGFNLDAAKQATTLKAVQEFAGTAAKVRAEAGPDADRDAMRKTMEDARTKLHDSLKGVLTEDQIAKLGGPMGGGAGGRPGRGGPGGGGGGEGGGKGGGGGGGGK